MAKWALAFALGVLVPFAWTPAVPLLAALPSTLLRVATVAVAGAALTRRNPFGIALFALAGATWAFAALGDGVARVLPATLEGEDVTVTGRLLDVPQASGAARRFRLAVESLCGAPASGDCLESRRTPARIRLAVYEPGLAVKVGERWRFTVRLKRPHGFANPGGFDYEAWLFRHRLHASGYVRPRSAERLAPAGWHGGLARLRARVAARVAADPDVRTRRTLAALVTGERRLLTPGDWALLSATGTTHLLVVSGLHVGLVAGVTLILARGLAGVFGGAARNERLAVSLAFAAALAYGALAGLGLPVRRALLMLAVALAATAAIRRRSPWGAWCLALALVLAADPLAPLDAGFWLSFAAVAALLAATTGGGGTVAGRGDPPARGALQRARAWLLGRGAAALRPQVFVAVALAPLLGLAFNAVPWSAPFVNLIAIPLVGLWVLPTGLAGAGLALLGAPGAEGALGLAAAGLALVWGLLEHVPKWVTGVTLPSSPLVAYAAAGVLVAACRLPRAVRLLGLAALLALLAKPPRALPEGVFRLTVLDVGQGLAAVVETAEATLVYDTGPSFGSGSDAGSLVLVPALRALGRTRVDVLVVSHADDDHAGGAATVLRTVPVDRVLSGSPDALASRGVRAHACRRGQRWRWTGVHIAVLHPAGADGAGERDENDRSCVLSVRGAHGSALLTGDIGAGVERSLVQAGLIEPATLLVAAHHGSGSSSKAAFVAAAAPAHVVFSAGYRSRYGHPAAEVVARFRRAGAVVYRTAARGALRWRSDRRAPQAHRPERPAPWAWRALPRPGRDPERLPKPR